MAPNHNLISMQKNYLKFVPMFMLFTKYEQFTCIGPPLYLTIIQLCVDPYETTAFAKVKDNIQLNVQFCTTCPSYNVIFI